MSYSSRSLLFSGFSFWVVLAFVGMYLVYPLDKNLKRGIDLVGGTYITLEVQTEKAVEDVLVGRMQAIPQKLKDANVVAPQKKSVENGRIILEFTSVGEAQAAAQVLKDKDVDLVQKTTQSTLELSFNERAEEKIKREAVQSNIEVLNVRLNKMSVAEITIAAQGERRIIVELPDVDDPQQAKTMIGKPAMLEFKLVDRTGSSKDDILYEYDGEMPEGKEIVKGRDGGFYLVPQYTDITGRLLKDARPGFGGQTGAELVVNFQFNSEGGDKFYELTSKNYGKQLAVILDNEVITAPSINAAIHSEGQITGRFTSAQAKELAMLLKSGAFVAPVTFEQERQIGPTLGAESVRKGLISCLVGLGLLLLFSLYYYNLSGLFAFIALVYNLLLTLIGLALLKATLTLPGIAGMVLTIGMAVDASILIYERIKEELAAGISIKKAVNAGFSNAMVVILDANITTFIVGVVLYRFGTGPVQGFAVTMMLGIVSTLITGLFFLRSLFNLYLDNFTIQKLRI